MTGNNYLNDMLKEAERLGQSQSNGIHHITVLHDDWCQLLKGNGPCNCQPDVSPAISHREFIQRN